MSFTATYDSHPPTVASAHLWASTALVDVSSTSRNSGTATTAASRNQEYNRLFAIVPRGGASRYSQNVTGRANSNGHWDHRMDRSLRLDDSLRCHSRASRSSCRSLPLPINSLYTASLTSGDTATERGSAEVLRESTSRGRAR